MKEAVALGRLLPPDASRDELRAYNKLAGKLTQHTRQWRLAMEKQEKAELEQKTTADNLPEATPQAATPPPATDRNSRICGIQKGREWCGNSKTTSD